MHLWLLMVEMDIVIGIILFCQFFFFFSRMQTADPISYIVISDNKQLQCSMLSHRDCVWKEFLSDLQLVSSGSKTSKKVSVRF